MSRNLYSLTILEEHLQRGRTASVGASKEQGAQRVPEVLRAFCQPSNAEQLIQVIGVPQVSSCEQLIIQGRLSLRVELLVSN